MPMSILHVRYEIRSWSAWVASLRSRCASHLLGCADAQHGQAIAQHLTDGDDQRKSCALFTLVVDQKTFRIIVTVEFLRQILQVERDQMRRQIARRGCQLGRK